MAPGKRNSGYPQRSGYDRVPKDFYPEPRSAVDQLLDSLDLWGEPLLGSVLDPCCGSGTIVSACLDRGIDINGSDIADRGFGKQRDLFTITEPVDVIISNVPYRQAEECLRHMLTIARDRVILILRLTFWESRRRHALHLKHPPLWWAPCSDRPSMPPGVIGSHRDHNGALVQPGGKDGTAPYAWFCWRPGYSGSIETRFLQLRPKVSRRHARPPTLSAVNVPMGAAK